MKNVLLLAGAILVFSIFSCKKGNDAAPPNGALPKIYTEDTRTYSGGSFFTYNMTYDSKNRLTGMVSMPAPTVSKFVYQYPDDHTVIKDHYFNNQLFVHEKFWLNSFSLVDSTVQYIYQQDTLTEKYVYDPNHLLTTIDFYSYSGSVSTPSHHAQYTYDNNGNPLTQTDYTGTINYTYYTDLPYTISMGLNFIAHPKNFIKTATLNPGGALIVTTHYYTFDSSNRLTKDSSFAIGADQIVVLSYGY